MKKYDLIINTKKVELQPNNLKVATVTLEDVELSEVLDQIPISEILNHIDNTSILEEIGIDFVKKYFGLAEIED